MCVFWLGKVNLGLTLLVWLCFNAVFWFKQKSLINKFGLISKFIDTIEVVSFTFKVVFSFPILFLQGD